MLLEAMEDLLDIVKMSPGPLPFTLMLLDATKKLYVEITDALCRNVCVITTVAVTILETDDL